MLDLNLRFHASCPKHPVYRPSDGRGAIRGGCIYCEALFQIGEAETQVSRAVKEFEELMDRYNQKVVKPAVRHQASLTQPTLFPMEAKGR